MTAAGGVASYHQERAVVAGILMRFFEGHKIKADEIDAHGLASNVIERLDRLRARAARRDVASDATSQASKPMA